MAMTSEPSYYSNHAVKTSVKQDMIADILEEAGMPARRIHKGVEAIKYTDRMGEKDDVEKEAFKAANYLYAFAEGRWIGEEPGTQARDERRKVASMIRENIAFTADGSEYREFANCIANVIDPAHCMTWLQITNRLADLIDPD